MIFEMFSGKDLDSHHDIILSKLFCNLTQSINELIFVKILMSSAYKSTSQLKSSTANRALRHTRRHINILRILSITVNILSSSFEIGFEELYEMRCETDWI
jgi:hypothetical protein